METGEVVKRKKELCPHCGATMESNSYSLSKTLVACLRKVYSQPGVSAKTLFPAGTQYANYTKLKFWNYIVRDQTRDGVWFITQDGKDFLNGRIRGWRQIRYFRNKLIWTSEETVSVFDIVPVEESKQKYRELMVPVEQLKLDL